MVGITVAVPRLGVATALGMRTFGNLVAALVADHFGWLSAEAIPLAPRRLAGAALLLAGALLMWK